MGNPATQQGTYSLRVRDMHGALYMLDCVPWFMAMDWLTQLLERQTPSTKDKSAHIQLDKWEIEIQRWGEQTSKSVAV